MFNIKNINCLNNIDTWEEAIKIASHPLLEYGYIKSKYIDNMIENIHKLGFYVVIDDFVAMPHSRPEDGVLKSSVSFLKINSGVLFGNEKVYLLFILAAKDSDSHIKIIQKIMEIIDDERIKNDLMNAKTKEELEKILI